MISPATLGTTQRQWPDLQHDLQLSDSMKAGHTKSLYETQGGSGRLLAGTALGLSLSSISEFVGHGRGPLMAKDRWAEAKVKLAAFAKSSLK